MYLTDTVNHIINILKSNEYFNDKSVIAAYPFAYKPGRLGKIIITVSPQGIEAENISSGGYCLYGSTSVRADVFVPHEMGSPVLEDVIEHIISTLSCTFPHFVKVSPIISKNNLSSFTANCTLTYKSKINFGGNDD